MIDFQKTYGICYPRNHQVKYKTPSIKACIWRPESWQFEVEPLAWQLDYTSDTNIYQSYLVHKIYLYITQGGENHQTVTP